MTISDVQTLWHQSLFDEYGLRKLCFLKERQDDPGDFPSFIPKGRKVGEKVITACYIQDYLINELLYGERMCQMRASSLSTDHTFKVSANIGFWFKGRWIQLYDSLFIVMNEIGVVVSWKRCKGTGFHGVKEPLQRLKDRLNGQGCSIDYFFVDNCCQWRSKLNAIFESSAVKLDPFHAIQRFTSKIPKKGIKGSPIRRLRSLIVTDFKLVIRDPTDHGKKRTKPTPSKEIIKTNIVKFLKSVNPKISRIGRQKRKNEFFLIWPKEPIWLPVFGNGIKRFDFLFFSSKFAKLENLPTGPSAAAMRLEI